MGHVTENGNREVNLGKVTLWSNGYNLQVSHQRSQKGYENAIEQFQNG